MIQKILIIEDEADIREELTLLLNNEGYHTIQLTDFNDVAIQVNNLCPHLVLLDLGLPERDGFSLCMDIRRISKVPIIFVTSRDTSMDELKALSMGGDDYITKPYNIPVLLAHVKAVLRRSSNIPKEEQIEVSGLCLNLSKGIITHDDKFCDVTKNEMKILTCLMHKAGEIVLRTYLIDYLWDNQIYIDDNTLSVNITRLRTKLDSLGLPDYITTKRGMGYKI